MKQYFLKQEIRNNSGMVVLFVNIFGGYHKFFLLVKNFFYKKKKIEIL